MMKRILLAFIFSCIYFLMQAQDFKVVSVEALPQDMTAREFIKTDDKDRQCAVIRIATQNIPLSLRKDFHFESDWGSSVVERTLQDGEILIWVSPGLKTLKIKHEKLGKWELHTTDYGIKLESLQTYKIVLQGTVTRPTDAKPEVTQQYLAFQISPANAVLEVDGQLWEVDSEGMAKKFVNFGTYNYRVMAPNYHPETGTVTVDDPDNTKKVNVQLKSDLVEVTLKVDADAEIWVNNEKKGIRTWTGALGQGTYKIECKQRGHQTSTSTREIADHLNGKTINLTAPKPIYGSLNVESTPSLAKVYVDGKEVGETPKFLKELLIGPHRLKLTKEGYEDYEEAFVIKTNERTQVSAKLQNSVRIPGSEKPQVATILEKPMRSFVFAMANFSYSLAPQAMYGLTVGSVRKYGWYASFASGLHFDSFDYNYKCDANGVMSDADNLYRYKFTGEEKTPCFVATAGVVFRVSNPLYLYVGGGYGQRSLISQYQYGVGNDIGTLYLGYGWAKNTDVSCRGVALDTGFIVLIDELSLSLGVRTIGLGYLEGKLGIGYIF